MVISRSRKSPKRVYTAWFTTSECAPVSFPICPIALPADSFCSNSLIISGVTRLLRRCSCSLVASVCYPFCTTWTKDVLSLQFGWEGQYQHPHTQVSLVSRTNRNASNWDDTPYGISNILRCCMQNVRDKTLSKQRPQVLSWVNCFQNTNQMGGMLFGYRVRTGHGKPGKSWNLRISFSRPWKSWNLIVGPGKSWKIKDLYNR